MAGTMHISTFWLISDAFLFLNQIVSDILRIAKAAENVQIRKILKKLTPSGKVFFPKNAEEAILRKGYPADEELFCYCCFLTLRERMRTIVPPGSKGYRICRSSVI